MNRVKFRNVRLNVAHLYQTGKFSDVTFVVENMPFTLHKNILAVSCDYFATMLYGNTNEASMNEITLTETSKDSFAKVVEFIYTGDCDVGTFSAHQLADLMSLAHLYQYSALIKALEGKLVMTEEATFDYVITIMNLVFIDDFGTVKTNCLNYFDSKSLKLIEDGESFALLSFKAVSDILSRDTFFAKEIDIFQALQEWIRVNGVTVE